MKQFISKTVLVIAVLLSLFHPEFSKAYGLLAHEAIIDASWEKSIKPFLKQKYPAASDSELKVAHAYVYGGSIISDIGYYPFGSVFFTHMLHYVRSGDFVKALFNESKDINEYAFSLGVLCHYISDAYGHPLSTNRAVPILFPDLKEKYGDVVSFEQAPAKHVRVEFGFDVLQTAKGNYVSQAYHDFIGFKISQSVLERAFFKTYGIEVKHVFPSLPAAAETFRFTVKSLFPELTNAAWKIRQSVITQANPLATEKSYNYKIDKASYKKEFGKPSLFSPLVIIIYGILPKIGPLEKLKFKAPDEKAEKLFDDGFKVILNHYSTAIKNLHSKNISFENYDLDTGGKTKPGEYEIADKSYYKLLKKLRKAKNTPLDEDLKANLMQFYNQPDAAKAYEKHPAQWKKINKALRELDATQFLPASL